MTNSQPMHTLPGRSQFPTTRWTLVVAAGDPHRKDAQEESRSEERGVGKGRHVLSPPQHTVTQSATSAPVEPSSPGVRPSH
ncbi:MAG: hypothetical protein ACLQOO_13115 [Terriglobia bacterium]